MALLDPMTIQLLTLAVVVIILIGICVYRVAKNIKTERRNSTIFFLLIWVFTFVVVILGLVGKYLPIPTITEPILRFADSLTVLILLMMSFFACSILYGSIYKERNALLIMLYVAIESVFIVIFYWVMPATVRTGENFDILYAFPINFVITIAYFPMILPILYLFIKMEQVDKENKWKYRLYLVGFICAIMELAFDMPGTLPEFLFVWRSFALVAMIIVIVALLLPRKSS